MSQGPDQNFFLGAAQWEVYFKKGKLFLRITFISLLIPDPEMGQHASCAANGIFEKSLNKCKVTNLPVGVLTHSYALLRIRDDFVLSLFCCQPIFHSLRISDLSIPGEAVRSPRGILRLDLQLF